jgi:PAS domain S-box-containing protein
MNREPHPLLAATAQAQADAARRPRTAPRSLRGVLVGLLFVPLAPLALLSGAFVWTQWQASRDGVFAQMEQSALSMAVALDREIEVGRAILETLVSAEAFERGDWTAFRRGAARVMADRRDAWIDVVPATPRPSGPAPTPAAADTVERPLRPGSGAGPASPMSTLGPGLVERVAATGRMANSGLHVDPTTGQPWLAIAVPVERDGRVTHVAILGFTPDRLNRLTRQIADGAHRVTLLDATGTIIATSLDAGPRIGRVIDDAPRRTIAQNERGVVRGQGVQGEALVGAFRRSRLTDWTVIVGDSIADTYAPAWRALAGWSALLLTLLGVSAWAARTLWNRLAPPLAAMGRAAPEIQRGTLPTLPPSGIVEIEELAALLREAARAEARSRDEALHRAVAEEAARAARAGAEESARAQARFRASIEHLPQGVVIHDAERRFEYLNGRAATLLGRPRDALLGQRVGSAWPDAAGTEYVRNLEAAIGCGTVRTFEWSPPTVPEGAPLLSISHAPMWGGGGRLQQVLTIVYDMTERREAELARAASEQLLRRVLDNVYMFVAVLDADGTLIEVNRLQLERAGLSRADVIGRPLWDRPWWHHEPGTREALRHAIERARAGESVRLDLQSLSSDGSIATTDFQVAPLRDASGRVTLLVACGVDVTDRKRTEAALRDADRQKDDFLAVLSHELRNPLAPIVAANHVIRSRTAHDPELAGAAAVVERQAAQLTRLVDDLLEVSRIRLGRIELRLQPESLADVVAGSLEAVRPAIEAARHRLELSIASEPIVVDADAARLSQAIQNLLHNAVKFTPEAGRIGVRVDRDGARARISIDDTGVGIDATTMPQLFGMFVQGARGQAASQGGLGIGLALARQLVELHGGTIEAHSDGHGRGSRFEILLPVRTDACPAAPPQSPAARPVPRQVLVVDDNVDAAEALRMMLELEGHAVRTVHDGRAALAAVADALPDVVLLDIGLPGLDGLEVARRLKTRHASRCPRLIAISGWGQARDKQQALEAGFEQHFTKPVDPLTVAAVVAGTPEPSDPAR